MNTPNNKAPQPLIPKKKEGTGQQSSQERGSGTHNKKNPGKRPSQGGGSR